MRVRCAASLRILLPALTCLTVLAVLTVPAASARAQVAPPALDPLRAAEQIQKAQVAAIARAEKSVVGVARIRNRPPAARTGPRTRFTPPPRPRAEDELSPAFVPNEFGSGVIIEAGGLILTNYHVLGDPKQNHYVVWVGKQPYRAQRVLAADPWMDLAVLKIEATGLKPIAWGMGEAVKKGHLVAALGNPYAIAREGQPSAVTGIVSNVRRKAPPLPASVEFTEGNETLHHFGTLLQTTARLPLGASGGALINLAGEMIGMTTAMAAGIGYEPVAGFAIPVDKAFRRAVEKLKRGQVADYGVLGLGFSRIEVSQQQPGKHGALVSQIMPGAPASVAGLRAGDIITHFDGQRVDTGMDLVRIVSSRMAEDKVLVSFERGPQRLQRTVVLGKRLLRTVRPVYATEAPKPWRGVSIDYATVLISQLDFGKSLDPRGCIAVIDVASDSPGWKAGLRPGDLVSFVGEQRVASPRAFYDAVRGQSGPVRLRKSFDATAKGLVIVAP